MGEVPSLLGVTRSLEPDCNFVIVLGSELPPPLPGSSISSLMARVLSLAAPPSQTVFCSWAAAGRESCRQHTFPHRLGCGAVRRRILEDVDIDPGVGEQGGALGCPGAHDVNHEYMGGAELGSDLSAKSI